MWIQDFRGHLIKFQPGLDLIRCCPNSGFHTKSIIYRNKQGHVWHYIHSKVMELRKDNKGAIMVKVENSLITSGVSWDVTG
jgi:hypothetical protein